MTDTDMDSGTQTIEIELDSPRSLMHEELVELFGEDLVQEELDARVQTILTELYDNRDELLRELNNGR